MRQRRGGDVKKKKKKAKTLKSIKIELELRIETLRNGSDQSPNIFGGESWGNALNQPIIIRRAPDTPIISSRLTFSKYTSNDTSRWTS